MAKNVFGIVYVTLLVFYSVSTHSTEESTESLQKLIKCTTNHIKELAEKCSPKHDEIGKSWLSTANEAKVSVPCVITDGVLKEKLENCTAESAAKPNKMLMDELLNATLNKCLSKTVLQKLDLLENDMFSKEKAEKYMKEKLDEKVQEVAMKDFNKCLEVYPNMAGYDTCMPYYKGLECTDITLNHEAVECAAKECASFKD